MYIVLFDRDDRLGAHIINYISQIIYAHANNYYIMFINNDSSKYRFANSKFVVCLFNYINEYNKRFSDYDKHQLCIPNASDYISVTSFVTMAVKSDLISYFRDNIYNEIADNFISLTKEYSIPFDIDKTILVHLRLDDRAHCNDYDGSFCSNYYKQKINNNEACCCEFYDSCNNQAPLNKEKLEYQINKAREKYPDYKVILLTSPSSDTSFLDYRVIKNADTDYDLFLLCVCKVVILSRSTYSLSSLMFSTKKDCYMPLWGHFVCCGLDTKYDKNAYNYFY